MALETCPECEADVSSSASACPRCGFVFPVAEERTSVSVLRVLNVAFGALLVVAVVFLLWSSCGTRVVVIH